jgi:copper transport protein
MSRTTVYRLATVVASLILLMMVGPTASAHSELERSDPSEGATVAEGRSTFTLWFTEPVAADTGAFAIRPLDGTPVRLDVVAADAAFVELESDPLSKGSYVLDWEVGSADGHDASGAVVFGVGMAPLSGQSAQSQGPEAVELIVRWLDLAALMVMIGALAVSGRVLGALAEPRRRARMLAALASVVAVGVGALLPIMRTPRGASSLGDWLDTAGATVLETTWGHQWLVRELALVVAAVALSSWASGRTRSGLLLRVGVAAVGTAVLLQSWFGHAAELPRSSGLAALITATHIVAAGVWAGGLTVLAVCLVPLMWRDKDARGTLITSVWRTFSPMAAVATVVLLATGLYASGRHLPDLQAVTSTVYGTAVGAKVLLLGVALAVAGFNTLILNPRLTAPLARRLGRSTGWPAVSPARFPALVTAEVLVLVLAVGAAALLTSVPTAREVALAARVTAPGTASVGGVFVSFEALPAGTDQSRLIARTRVTDKTLPEPITGLDVTLTDQEGTSVTESLDMIEPGRFEVSTEALAAGSWHGVVAVSRQGLPPVAVPVDLTVEGATPSGVTPLERVLTVIAVLISFVLAIITGFARRRPLAPVWSGQQVPEQTRSGS